MFKAKTDKILDIATKKEAVIKQLTEIMGGNTRVYIDYANVRPWSQKLNWHIDLKRLKQFFDSFDNVSAVNFYNGLLSGDERSEREKIEVEKNKYILRTKPVKIMKFSIDASSIAPDSTVHLGQFVRRALLKKYEVNTIEYLNERFRDMNKKGEMYIEDKKCNFDVEIGIDMLLDFEKNNVDTFILWSGDSDFMDPIKKLLGAGKQVVLFATARRVSKELNELKDNGLIIFDIQKIRNFICWNKELKQKGPQ